METCTRRVLTGVRARQGSAAQPKHVRDGAEGADPAVHGLFQPRGSPAGKTVVVALVRGGALGYPGLDKPSGRQPGGFFQEALRMRIIATLVASGFVALSLSGCAGTPPGGVQTASATRHHKCTPSTGSMFCNTADDQPYGSLSAPNPAGPGGGSGNLNTRGLGGP
jgi:hypothetical protein